MLTSVVGNRNKIYFHFLDDVQIKFSKEDANGERWEAFADIKRKNIHRQVGITFQTPTFQDMFLERSVRVKVCLFRPSDGKSSNSLDFMYIPMIDF